MLVEPKWHPILACEEYQPGRWVMLDQYRRPYALIDIIRILDQVGYKVTTWEQQSADRQLIGYYTSLRAAARSGHQRFLSRHTAASPNTTSPASRTATPAARARRIPRGELSGTED